MTQPWLLSFVLALICPFWLWGWSLRPGIRLIFALAGIALVGGVVAGSLAGLLFVLIGETAFAADRFLQARARTFKFTERELAGIALYILPLLAMVLSAREGAAEAASLLTVFFFVLRLMVWPLSPPFEEKPQYPLHNIFVLYWCNLSVLVICRHMILPEHIYLFLLPAVVNAVTGSVFGAVFLGLAYIGLSVTAVPALYGPVGVALVMFSEPGRRSFSKRLALVSVFALCAALSFLSPESRETMASRPVIFGLMLLLGGATIAHQIRKKILGFSNAPGLDIYRAAFDFLSAQRDPEVAKAPVSVPVAKSVAASSDQFVGSLGQYLFWLFLLTIVLVIGGALL